MNANPSLLNIAINTIAENDFDDSLSENEIPSKKIEAFDIDEKITYNSIKRNITLLNEYKIFHSKINKLYNEIEIQGSFKKEKLLRNIRNIYLKVLGKYVDSTNKDIITIIRENADDIFEEIENLRINFSN